VKREAYLASRKTNACKRRDTSDELGTTLHAQAQRIRTCSRSFSRVEMWRGESGSRFHIPLIKPDMRVSRIRLSDKVIHAFAHGRLAVTFSSRSRPSFP